MLYRFALIICFGHSLVWANPDLSMMGDINGNGVPEVAVLNQEPGSVMELVLSDSNSGAVINTLGFFNANWTAQKVLDLGDGRIGALASRNDGLPGIQLKTAADGTPQGNVFPWSNAWTVMDALVVPGAAPGGGPAIAALATRNQDGLMGVELRNPDDNTRTALIYPLGLGWTPSAFATLSVNGNPAIGVLASRDSDNLWIVQVRDIATGNLIRNVFPLGFGWTAQELQTLPDVNGNNVGEVAVRMTRNSDGLEVIQVRDGQTNALVRNVYPIGAGGGGWQTQTFAPVADGAMTLLAILSSRDSDGATLVQRKNPLSGALVNNVWYIGAPWTFAGGLQTIQDFTNNDNSEIAVLAQNGDSGQRLAQIRDGALGNVLRNVAVVGADEPPDPIVATNQVFTGLSFSQPVFMTQRPGDSSQWYLLEKGGIIRNFPNDTGTQTSSTYLNIQVASGGEGGLLGLAFHPDFNTNNAAFVYYTASVSGSLRSQIASFIANGQNTQLQTNTESVILEVGQPFDNHNGGGIAFGKDGNLYIGFGDGGGSNDDLDNAQTTSTLLGAFARINVDAISSYSVPTTNPFVNTSGFAPETYAYGFRNPWRWSFDTLTGTLWAGDVGQGRFEEIDIVRSGENHGWRCYEGNSMFNTEDCPAASELTFPVYDYPRSDGRSVTGGYVYRGDNIPNLKGAYVYGDFATGRVWALRPLSDGTYRNIPLLDTDKSIAAFAQGNDGEIYFLSFNDGEIYQLVPGF